MQNARGFYHGLEGLECGSIAEHFPMRNDSPSDTAMLVARSILLAAEDVRLCRLVAPQEAEVVERILAVAGQKAWFEFALKHGWARRALFRLERAMVPGIVAHYLARKRRIELAVREALASGIRQVVVAGAGFDTLAARLCQEFPSTLFLELDHPATQAVKRRALSPAPNLQFHPVDLATEALAPALSASPDFSNTRSSIFIAEGLTMYLSAARVGALFRSLAELAGPAGRVIFTFMEQGDDGAICFRGENPIVSRWLQSRREPFLWGIPRKALPAFLETHGLGGSVVLDDHDLRAEILAPRELVQIPLAQGECLCLCSPLI